jgi:hypothetical protein
LADPLLGSIERLEGTVGEMRAAEVARAESAVTEILQANFEALTQAHTDLADIVKAPEYAAWVAQQPPGIQRTVQENSEASRQRR